MNASAAASGPCVSVLMANYNGARHIAAAVRSVLGQSLGDLELIVIDDASSDDSLAVVAKAAAGDPRVRVLAQDRNAGPGAARNRGLEAARGRWIAVVDSDDLMAPDRLARLVDVAAACWAEVVVDNLIVFDDAGATPWRPFLTGAAYAEGRWLTLADYIASARMYSDRPQLGYLKPLICRRALDRTGVRYREDLRIGEDYDLILRLLAEGARMRLEPQPLYRYRRHAGSVSRSLQRAQLEAMRQADEDFVRAYPHLPDDARRAQAARRRSLDAALAYDGVIARLKAHDVAGGLSESLRAPGCWPLLAMPVKARLKRLAQRLAPHAAKAA
jgi:succinoglycan biosynthesis protein ExoO